MRIYVKRGGVLMEKGIIMHDMMLQLYRVPPQWHTPLMGLRNVQKKLRTSCCDLSRTWRFHRYGEKFSFTKDYYWLPLDAFSNFTDDELCKLRYTSTFIMDEEVEYLFDQEPCYRVVRKIISSMWRWGYSRGTWNEVVDAYTNLRLFHLHDVSDDFTIRLDHSTYP